MRIRNLTYFFSAFLACAMVPAIVNAKADECPEEDPECEILKPTFLIVLDYSSSMLEDFQAGGDSRWKVAKEAISNMLEHDGGFLEKNMHIAVLRFGHEGAPELLEGNILDVPWFDDANLAMEPWLECNGENIKTTLAGIADPPPAAIGTWTNGALQRVTELVGESKTLHPEDMDNRLYAALVITDGQWTGPTGLATDRPPAENPALTAASLLTSNVKTYVVAITPNADNLMDANELAAAGGTTDAIKADTPSDLTDALVEVVKEIQDSVVPHNCAGKLPRVMMILDSSSSMTWDPTTFMLASEEGKDLWDQGRFVIAGQTINDSGILTAEIPGFNGTFEDLSHIGVSTFNRSSQLLVNYGPCMRDNVLWSLDPKTSCVAANGCMDAWGPAPRAYTYQSPGDPNYPDPPFVHKTMSYAPPCLNSGIPQQCAGTGTRTDLGLKLAELNQQAYHEVTSKLNESSIYVTNDDTPYLNILITDGQFDFGVGPKVRSSLESMAINGIKTYVVGVGNAAMIPGLIDDMATWGGTEKAHSAETPEELEQALTSIVGGIEFDRCCKMNDCSQTPEPEGEVDDPPPEIPEVDLEESGSTTTGTDTSSTSSTDTGTTGTDSDTTGNSETTAMTTGDSSTSSTDSTDEDSSTTAGDSTSTTTTGESEGDSTESSSSIDDESDATGGDVGTAGDGGEDTNDDSDSGPDLSNEGTGVGCGCTTTSDPSPGALWGIGFLLLGWGATRRKLSSLRI